VARTLSRRLFLGAAGSLAALPTASAAAAAGTAPFPQLRRRPLGRTGLKVTELGAGCEAVSDVGVLKRALDLGINFFDTARSYQAGNNERFLRAALGTRRKEYRARHALPGGSKRVTARVSARSILPFTTLEIVSNRRTLARKIVPVPRNPPVDGVYSMTIETPVEYL
jgi:hypothetical protein